MVPTRTERQLRQQTNLEFAHVRSAECEDEPCADTETERSGDGTDGECPLRDVVDGEDAVRAEAEDGRPEPAKMTVSITLLALAKPSSLRSDGQELRNAG